MARPDLACVLHVHETASQVIGEIEEKLVILSQGGCRLYQEVGYHGFEGLAEEEDEVPRMLADLGGDKHTLIMLNHGLLSVGATLGEAFGFMRALIDACRLQERVMATGGTMRPVSDQLQAHTEAQMNGRRGNAPREDISWAYWLRLSAKIRAAGLRKDVPMDVFIIQDMTRPPLLRLHYPSVEEALRECRATNDELIACRAQDGIVSMLMSLKR